MNINLSNAQVLLLVSLALWELLWKAMALWRAAHRNQPYWFATLLILNTVGVLPMLYILYTNMKENQVTRLHAV